MVGPENQLALLIRALSVVRLVVVRFPSSSSLHLADLITPLAVLWRSSLLSEKEFCYVDAQDSHGGYDVHLGPHPYLRNGGRSGVEIKGEFHEVVVPLPTVLALYWYHDVFYHSSESLMKPQLIINMIMNRSFLKRKQNYLHQKSHQKVTVNNLITYT